MQLIMLLI